MSVVFGAVCEGVTDFAIIEFIARAIAGHDDIYIRTLQPSSDATSVSREGGWRLVYQWFKKNTPQTTSFLFDTGSLFESDDPRDQPCSAIIVQIDCDIFYQIYTSDNPEIGSASSNYDITQSTKDATILKAFMKETLENWIKINGSGADLSRYIFAIPYSCSEAWLVGHLIEEDNGELRFDHFSIFVNDICQTLSQTPPVRLTSFGKNPNRYRRYLKAIPFDINQSRAKFESLDSFSSYIESRT